MFLSRSVIYIKEAGLLAHYRFMINLVIEMQEQGDLDALKAALVLKQASHRQWVLASYDHEFAYHGEHPVNFGIDDWVQVVRFSISTPEGDKLFELNWQRGRRIHYPLAIFEGCYTKFDYIDRAYDAANLIRLACGFAF